MMAAILNFAILDSPILHKTQTQTNSIWLKLIHSHLMKAAITCWIHDGSHLEFCQLSILTIPWWSWILPSWIQPSQKISDSTSWWQPSSNLDSLSFSSQTLPRLVPTICTKKTSLIHSDSTWWWQPSWILPCWIQTLPSWIQTPCYLLSDSLKNTLTPLWLWTKLIQSDSNSFLLT